MNTLKIKETVLQPGRPKVAVPILGRRPEEIVEECNRAKELPCDLIEWRADYYLSAIPDLDQHLKEKELYLDLIKILDDINYIADTMPVIFTLRRKNQGGEVTLTEEQYESICGLAAQSGLADVIDLELLDGRDQLDQDRLMARIGEIHGCGGKVLLSYHDFTGMPTPQEVVNLAQTMAKTGADIYKISAMAYSDEDVKGLLKASAFLTQHGIGPLVMIAMGEYGKKARVAAGKYGSCLTFGAGAASSAPGQVDCHTLKKWLDGYYGEEK